MAVLLSRNALVNVWRERGYTDGYNGRPLRTPAEVSEAERLGYLQGYRHGAKAAA